MSKCVITLPSMTFAQKARSVLTANALTATPIRLTAEEAAEGCSWGVELACETLEEALHVLKVSDLPYRRVIRRSHDLS